MLNAYVTERGGSLVTGQFAGVSRNYQVSCGHDHCLTLNKYDMARDKWCYECADLGRYEKDKKIVESKGGKLLSDRYVSTHTPMEIEDASGKRFSLTAHQLAHGVWR